MPIPSDQSTTLPYDRWVEEALVRVVRRALEHVAREGLPGNHHFFITFATPAEGVVMPSHLRAQYPKEITIVLQHQFWNLAVDEEGFEVTVRFSGVDTLLRVPFTAITRFVDPAVNFGLQLKTASPPAHPEAAPKTPETSAVVPARGPAPPPAISPATAKDAAPPKAASEPKETASKDRAAEVITLDAFRKK